MNATKAATLLRQFNETHGEIDSLRVTAQNLGGTYEIMEMWVAGGQLNVSVRPVESDSSKVKHVPESIDTETGRELAAYYDRATAHGLDTQD